MIIGLSGPNASGKGEVAKYLQSKGYQVYSLSDVLREEAKKIGLDQSRKTLINFGYQLRKKYGEGILVKKVDQQIHQQGIHPEGNIVVDSIRNPGEIKELRKIANKKKVIILGIDAPERLRYERLLKRGRLGDLKNFPEFVQAEKRENSEKKYAQQISKCIQLADKIIINKGSLKQLQQKIDDFLKEIENEK